MSKKASTDTARADIAVDVRNVTKIFTQWQRENAGNGLIRNLLRPEKHVITALNDVSFQVKRGEFIAYAGPNGAGKSTTMKLLSGMLLPHSGSLSVLGLSPNRDRIQLMSRLGILFGNRTELWWDHPLSQSFEWKKVVWDIPGDVYEKNLKLAVDLLDIGSLLKTYARELSLGQRMRGDLAMMLLHGPEVILLDEPTLGLDVVAKRQMIEFLKRINREEGVTIVVTSHDMDDLEEMAQRILMISGGNIAYDGGFDGLRDITGNLTRIVISMENGKAPRLSPATLISVENGVYEFEVDLLKTPIQVFLQQLSGMERVKNIEIRKTPIEQVIAELFRVWKANNQ
ncbi:MAG TPA: ATP-binding cassette domain-containing protein [Feifaniaceae bacterium]|nr:ATP-binding cassette domain-containing protein [Feifaniaceae bacterium]